MKVKNLKFKYGDGREYGEEDGDATLIFFPIFQELNTQREKMKRDKNEVSLLIECLGNRICIKR